MGDASAVQAGSGRRHRHNGTIHVAIVGCSIIRCPPRVAHALTGRQPIPAGWHLCLATLGIALSVSSTIALAKAPGKQEIQYP